MADITKCEGKNCNLKLCCYRYLAEDTPKWQSYFSEDPNIDKNTCEMYWPIEENYLQNKASIKL